MKIGFIGLGHMGGHMARNVLASGDHEMQYQVQLRFEADHDAFAEPLHRPDRAPLGVGDRGRDAAHNEHALEAHIFEPLTDQKGAQALDVDDDVRQFRHGCTHL